MGNTNEVTSVPDTGNWLNHKLPLWVFAMEPGEHFI